MIAVKKKPTHRPGKVSRVDHVPHAARRGAWQTDPANRLRKRVLLLHGEPVTHYRVPIYNYFYKRFHEERLLFTVAGPNVQERSPVTPAFPFHRVDLCLKSCLRAIRLERPDVVILFSGLRNRFLLPLVWYLRSMHIPVIYWGHGINLSKKQSHRNLYALLHRSCHSLLLYADHLKQYIHASQWPKITIANNTLCLGELPEPPTSDEKREILERYGIETTPNIIFVGRMQKRKRLGDLLAATQDIAVPNLGVILVGPDEEGILPPVLPPHVRHLQALYGSDLLRLMMTCELCCCPGWVGLNIVDAMACGLPFVTEDHSDHAPEIMYLKHGYNGLRVPAGRIDLLSEALVQILTNEELRTRMSRQAKRTYAEDASIERMFQGFVRSIDRTLARTGVRQDGLARSCEI